MRLVHEANWSCSISLTELGKIEVKEFLQMIFLLPWMGIRWPGGCVGGWI